MFFTFYDITTLNSTYQDKLKAGCSTRANQWPPERLSWSQQFHCSNHISFRFDQTATVRLKRHSKETPPCTLGRGGDLIMASDMKPPQFEAGCSR